MNTYVFFLAGSQDLPTSIKRLLNRTSVFIRLAAEMSYGAAHACNVPMRTLVQQDRDERPHKMEYES
jgi:hypothetical protein